MVADTRISADAVPHQFYVGTEFLGQVGQLVHEADARGQHGVGGVLGQLRGTHIHDDQALVVALERRIELAHHFSRARVLDADDDAIRPHEVLDRGAFLEKLGVGNDAVVDASCARRQLLADRGAHLVGRAHRYRRLVHHDLVVDHQPADIARGGDDVLQVGRAIFVGRCADGDELDTAEGDCLGNVGGEAQAAGGAVARHHALQAGLVNRDAAGVEGGNLGRVDVKAEHVIADLSQTSARDKADITGTDDSDLHDNS